MLDDVHRALDPARLYELTGVQFLPFSTLYQLAAERRLEAGWQALLTPDLLGYWLTGVRAAEQTIASTTGLLDARTGDWAPEVLDGLGLPTGLLPDVVPPGRVLAGVTEPVRAELGLDHELLVSTVGSHDTASAVVGVPAVTPRFGYVSCGTWGLVGVELDAPVLTEAGRLANFHQRARRGRDDPLPAQRDGPLAAQRVATNLEPAWTRGRAWRRPRGGGRAAAGWPADRPGRPGVPAARRHARPHRPGRAAPHRGHS